MKARIILLSAILLITITGIQVVSAQQNEAKNPYYKQGENAKLSVSNADWKKVLEPKVYNILREHGTEPANSGPYVHNEKKGTYYCAACGHALFSSSTKFDSHTGWPSFYQTLNGNSVNKNTDNSDGMTRDEISCARCGGHLGHVFDDGPKPTGLRYCMDGYALYFVAGK